MRTFHPSAWKRSHRPPPAWPASGRVNAGDSRGGRAGGRRPGSPVRRPSSPDDGPARATLHAGAPLEKETPNARAHLGSFRGPDRGRAGGVDQCRLRYPSRPSRPRRPDARPGERRRPLRPVRRRGVGQRRPVCPGDRCRGQGHAEPDGDRHSAARGHVRRGQHHPRVCPRHRRQAPLRSRLRRPLRTGERIHRRATGQPVQCHGRGAGDQRTASPSTRPTATPTSFRRAPR